MFDRAQNTPLLYSEKTEIIFELFWNVSGDSCYQLLRESKARKTFKKLDKMQKNKSA